MTREQTPGTAVSLRSSTELAALNELDEILLTGELNVEIVDDPAEISRQIVAQLLAAGSDEELENFGNAEGWREHLGKPMEIRGFRWLPSTIESESGSAVFFVVQVNDLTDGVNRTLTTGSLTCLAQLSNMARRGTLVGAVREMVEAEKATRSGFKPLQLRTPANIRQARDAAAPQPADA